MSSLYIHVPFCKNKCLYCDFYSIASDKDIIEKYVYALVSQLAQLEQKSETVFIGGGTPTVIPDRLLSKLLGAVANRAASGSEWTIEANPESLTASNIKLMLAHGVNRISIGVQSFNDTKLKALGRIHDSEKAKDAVMLASKCGFKNIGVDLIFGMWNETLASWKNDLETAMSLPVKHISCYSLTYEKKTPLHNMLKKRLVIPLTDIYQCKMYTSAISELKKHGFRQYEISNFAKKGFECRHNQNYWTNNEYVGLGPSAASYIGGVRSKNVTDVKDYIRKCKVVLQYAPTNKFRSFSPLASKESLTPINRARETAAIKIRTAAGINFAWFSGKTGFDFLKLEGTAVSKLKAQGLVTFTKSGSNVIGVRLTRKGFIFADAVSSEFV